jgi:hypothetical protein
MALTKRNTMQVTEKEIEDWVCDNISEFMGGDDAALLGRQIHLSDGGILDVLALHVHEDYEWVPGEDQPTIINRPTLSVIELKAQRIDASALAQVLGYMGTISDELGAADDDNRRAKIPNLRVRGILSAPEITTEAMHALRGLDDRVEPVMACAPEFGRGKPVSTAAAVQCGNELLGGAIMGVYEIGQAQERRIARRESYAARAAEAARIAEQVSTPSLVE